MTCTVLHIPPILYPLNHALSFTLLTHVGLAKNSNEVLHKSKEGLSKSAPFSRSVALLSAPDVLLATAGSLASLSLGSLFHNFGMGFQPESLHYL